VLTREPRLQTIFSGPEAPFPAAPDDVKDMIDHVVVNAQGYFDTSRITIGGFSSGGTLALTAGVSQPKNTLKGNLH
jgi:acetyl esterase/lipase